VLYIDNKTNPILYPLITQKFLLSLGAIREICLHMQKALERTDISFFKALILQIQWLVSQAQPFNLKVSIGFVLLYNNSLNFVPIKDSLYNCCFLILPVFYVLLSDNLQYPE